MMPLPNWVYQRSLASKPTHGSNRPRKPRKRHEYRVLTFLQAQLNEKRLTRELEYSLYMDYTMMERRRYDREYVLRDWSQRLIWGSVVLVGYFIMGLYLDSAALDRPTPYLGVYFVFAGVLIAWSYWIWPLVRLGFFRTRARRYMRQQLAADLRKL